MLFLTPAARDCRARSSLLVLLRVGLGVLWLLQDVQVDEKLNEEPHVGQVDHLRKCAGGCVANVKGGCSRRK